MLSTLGGCTSLGNWLERSRLLEIQTTPETPEGTLFALLASSDLKVKNTPPDGYLWFPKRTPFREPFFDRVKRSRLCPDQREYRRLSHAERLEYYRLTGKV